MNTEPSTANHSSDDILNNSTTLIMTLLLLRQGINKVFTELLYNMKVLTKLLFTEQKHTQLTSNTLTHKRWSIVIHMSKYSNKISWNASNSTNLLSQSQGWSSGTLKKADKHVEDRTSLFRTQLFIVIFQKFVFHFSFTFRSLLQLFVHCVEHMHTHTH